MRANKVPAPASRPNGALPADPSTAVKTIQAIIRREKFGAVMDALERIDCPGFMAWAIEGRGRPSARLPARPLSLAAQLIPMVKLEVVAEDAKVELILRTIQESAATGREGDGKLFVSPVERAIRIRIGPGRDLAQG